MSRVENIIFGLGFFIILVGTIFGLSYMIKTQKQDDTWCSTHGYVGFRTYHGPNLCVDPKTRLVYKPE